VGSNATWTQAADALSAFLGDRLRVDEPMSKHTTIGVGGAARLMALPNSPGELARVVRYAIAKRLPYV
jgi:UDP-N-acetylmuramate dehydrogenase